MRNRGDIKALARTNFRTQYGASLGAFVVYALLTGVVSGTVIGALLLVPPLMVGYASFCLRIYRGGQGDVGEIFSTGFRDYGRSLGGILWMELFIFLWTWLFIIPGIIKALAYFATPYILAETERVPATQALKLSMRMTKGHKGKIFVMGLSFIGWMLLSGITCGLVGLLYANPYMNTSFAGLYEELKAEALRTGTIRPEELV